MQLLLAEVMDKMPALADVWITAVVGGIVSFCFSRYLPLGWLFGVLVCFFVWLTMGDWFVGSVAKYALMEDPVTTRKAQASLLVPVVGTALGLILRAESKRKGAEK